ncbi:MAG TPA: hypothetical protein VFP10_10580, partial [Candidatus Eisenbacteria bacterium]|nr:hypothetical protein [Candidatus Eisenbacteria bacterium]
AWVGKEDMRWGPGRSGGLLVGGGTEPVTHLGARVHAGTFATLSAVHGWLSEAHGQYVAYHRVELNLGKGLRVAIGEGVRYDGPSPDPLYLINLIPYAVVERIQSAEGDVLDAERDSLVRSNYIAAADFYWGFSPGWALYGEIMVDDVKDEAEETPSRLAYQAGAKHVRGGRHTLTLQAEYTRVYNYTYSVYYNRHFVHRERILGYPLGADLADARFWADLDLDIAWSLGLRAHYSKIGEGNRGGAWCPPGMATDNPYGTDCQTFGDASGRDFAGIPEEAIGFLGSIVYTPRDNWRFEVEAGVDFVDNADHQDGLDRTRPLGAARATWRW